jgi:sugar lactone lactonase YvrE
MNKWIFDPQFEEDIRLAFDAPAVRPEFVNTLHREIMRRAQSKKSPTRSPKRLRPAWSITLAILTLLTAVVLIVGPQRVYAAVVRLFGYIPGVGIVDESSPIRVLAEPVSVTRDGITITVSSATLTGNQTHIDYRIFGVPGSAYPRKESEAGCRPAEYLRLPDNSVLERENNSLAPMPADVNQAVFVIPCIANTLPGSLPENWELPLRFVPAPADLTVMPVYEQATATPVPTEEAQVPTDEAVTVEKVIETEDGYILIGQFQPASASNQWVQTSGMALTDAEGRNVPYTFPNDVSDTIPMNGWAAQFKHAGLSYPLTISFSGVDLLGTSTDNAVEFSFDAGPNPQPGDEWVLDRDFELAGYPIRLRSIMANSQNSYSFRFKADPRIYSVAVEILDHPANGGGGGGGGMNSGEFSNSLSYAQFPTGILTVRISKPVLVGDAHTWQGQWSPEVPHSSASAQPTSQPGLCLTLDALAQAAPVPADMAGGKAIFYEALQDREGWGLVQYNLDGTQRQVLAANANGGMYSTDGTRMAYPTDGGIHILDLATQSESVLNLDIGSFDLHWSPDGSRITFVGLSDTIINSAFIVDTSTGETRQISEWSYELIAGWSPDGTQLYYAVPFTGGAAWKIYRYNLNDGQTQELFTIENATAKALEPRISPDGQWIAYRGHDNSSVYLIRSDGSDERLVVENGSANGLAWTASGWLGVSLHDYQSEQTTLALIDPETCTIYRTTGLSGQLEDLYLP